MYAKSPDSLTLDLGCSRALIAVLVIFHGGAIILALLLPISIAIRAALVALAAVSLFHSARLHASRRARGAVVSLALNDEGGCAWRRRGSDAWEEGRIIERSVHRLLAIVVVRAAERRRSTPIVICADAVYREAFRRLRVRLRLQTAAVQESYRSSRSADSKQDSPE